MKALTAQDRRHHHQPLRPADRQPGTTAAVTLPAATAQGTGAEAPVVSTVTLEVNGTSHTLVLHTRTTLLDALREHLHLTDTKKGRDQGQCGYCTPGQLCTAVAVPDEIKRGVSSHVSEGALGTAGFFLLLTVKWVASAAAFGVLAVV